MESRITVHSSLYLQVSNGIVWMLPGGGEPTSSNMNVSDFLASEAWNNFSAVRALGIPANAALICSLFDRAVVQVCSPMACPLAEDRENPRRALLYATGDFNSPSQGGFHTVTEAEKLIYNLIILAQSPDAVNKLIPTAEMHPAWKPLSFAQGLNKESLARLLALVIDPRWYFQRKSPDRSSKYYSFLGLASRTQEHISLGLHSEVPWPERCRLVYSTWYSSEFADAILRGQPQRVDEPGMFLWRYWLGQVKRNQAAGPSKSRAIADLRTSRKLALFVKLVWLATIYRNSPHLPEQGASLFVPQMFFASREETEAFNLFVQS